MAVKFYDLTKPQNRRPKREVNGNRAPEDVARQVLDEAPYVEEIIARAEHQRQFGIPKAEMHKPEPPKRQASEHALRLARMLLDPNFGRRR